MLKPSKTLMLRTVQAMDKGQFITLCKNDPEEVFKLFWVMGETINTLRAQLTTFNEQMENLQEIVKSLKSRLDLISSNSNKPLSTEEFVNPKRERKKAARKRSGKRATVAIP